MDKLFGILPASIIGWSAIVIAVIASITYLISKIRANDMKILRDTNRDQGDRIALLEAAVERLTMQVDGLEKKNKTLEDLVMTALKQYFFEHPDVAQRMQEEILK